MIDLIAHTEFDFQAWMVARGLIADPLDELSVPSVSEFNYIKYGSGRFYSVVPTFDDQGDLLTPGTPIPGVFWCMRFPAEFSIKEYFEINAVKTTVADDLSGYAADGVTLIKPADMDIYLTSRGQPTHTWLGGTQWSDPEMWVQQTYNIGSITTWNKTQWESLINNNVWQPPIGWREVAVDGPVAWQQPSGAADAYALGEEVTHNGNTWVSLQDGNVFEPGVSSWQVVTSGTPRWQQPSGAQDAYDINAEVIHDRPQDGGADWLFRSNIVGNTTEPGRDGTFDRWWFPVQRV